jgi:L-alanine-DL-glutamate epimerase-like enolase superfamily enzyme
VLKAEERPAPASAAGRAGTGGGAPVARAGEKFTVVVTNSGLEVNYVLADRYYHTNRNNQGWLDCAKGALTGKSALDLPNLTSQWKPSLRAYASSQHLRTVEEFVADVEHAQSEGFTAYKIHPPGGHPGTTTSWTWK